MNIPLSRLYDFIEKIAKNVYGDNVIIYRFFPHGSKNIQDLQQTRHHDWLENNIYPNVWCHDQEPLNFKYYSENLYQINDEYHPTLNRILGYNPIKNLNYIMGIFEKDILLHSEQRSQEVERYADTGELIPVYYWSHAVIARDWFRYAQHVSQHKNIDRTFLVYNRAWSGTREYRLRFAESIVQKNLQDQCRMSINPTEPELGIHYTKHTFINPAWRPSTLLEKHFPISHAKSHYSADFDLEDYEATQIEVVLETLFDDHRLHLTEKIFRPIACGQPFILASTQGSLQYLRSYGFQTFSDVWDESYDLIEDPTQRLDAITDLMQTISQWDTETWDHKQAQITSIVQHNRQHFFSQGFFDSVVNELTSNMRQAFAELKTLPANKQWIDIANCILNTEELRTVIANLKSPNGNTLSNIELALERAKQLP